MAKFEKETSPLIRLEKGSDFDIWGEHLQAFKTWDDLGLARWLNQTLGQLHDHCWRASHPLVMVYRLAAAIAYQRDLWNRRIFPMNEKFSEAACCGSPAIPFVSFEIATHGIYCSCCGSVLEDVGQLPGNLPERFKQWARKYDPLHEIAHFDEVRQRASSSYEEELNHAANDASPLLAELGYQLAPQLLGLYPVVIWEDSDHCLDILPEEIAPL
jgi:hypothetical protein